MKIFFAALGLLTATICYAQDYAYVRDDDMYVYVRSDANINSPVIDTVYNLQIVKINTYEEEKNGWVPAGMGRGGYIHKSRLRAMPAEYTASLDEALSDSATDIFITAVECPEIVVSTYLYRPEIEEYTTGWNRGRHRVTSTENHTIRNLKTGEILEEFSVIYPVEMTIYPSRLIFSSSDFTFYYYRNQNDKTCRGLTFLNTGDILTLSPREQADVLAVAREAYENQSTDNIDVNDFEYWSKLESLYLRGNADAQKFYPYLMPEFPTDGEGSHVIEKYLGRKWAYDNRGEVVL